jgi:hypothetical protein
MIFDITTFTLIHTLVSLVAISAGLVVMGGLMAGKRLDGWVGLFLVTTALTSLTGFGFPFTGLIASHYVGIISLVILPAVIYARYEKYLLSSGRGVFVVGTALTLYLNFFVLVVQLFRKVPALLVSAPTQKEPPFVVSQILVMALFAVLSVAAYRKFPPQAVKPFQEPR